MSEFRRQHPVAAITRVLQFVRQNFITLLFLLFIGGSGNGNFIWYIGIGLVTGFVLGIASWYRFTYRVKDGEIQIHQGIFVRNKMHLPKERIQVIDITEGLVQRMFSLVQLEIKSAGGGTQSATISAMSREEAESLRDELRAVKPKLTSDNPLQPFEFNGDLLSGDIERLSDESENYQEWKISRRDLLYAALTSGNFGLIASILGAISGQTELFINDENIEYLMNQLPGYSNVTVILGVVVGILVISWLLSFLGVVLKYSDFRIQKKEKELLITSGLLERKHITVPFDRIQAVRFVEGLIRQPFGYGMLYVESAGFDQTNQGRSIVLAPYIAAEDITEFLNTFLSDFGEPEMTIRPPKRSLYRYLRRPLYLFIPLVAGISWFWPEGWWAMALLPLLILLGWARYRDAGLALDDDQLRVRFRNLARTTAMAKRKRIQNAESSCHYFQQRKNLQHLSVAVASGMGGLNFEVQDLDEKDCESTLYWLAGKQEQAAPSS